MKKLFLCFCIPICFFSQLGAQTPLHSIAKAYLRSHPFDMKFSSFVLSLQKDPWFTIEEYSRRTDTSFFFISGVYKNFNPFHFTPKQIKFIIAEQEVVHQDSLHTIDTIMNLQLLGIADSSDASKKMVEKEFNRFHNNQASKFSSNNYIDYKSNAGNLTAEIYNYFISPLLIAPVTTAWGFLPDTKNYTFTITIRFKVIQNMANYVAMPGELEAF